MPSPHRTLRLTVAALLTLLAACSSSNGAGTGGAGGGGVGDGKVHPAGNGTPQSESDACHALTGAVSSLSLSLGCVTTVPTCPDFLRAEFGTSCLQYDEGSVQGCVSYYGMQKTCDALATAIADCAVSPIADSAPKGCP